MPTKIDEITKSYLDNPEKVQLLFKRTMIIVVLSQIFGGAGLAAGITVGALLAEQMLGTNALAGLPAALFTLGSALAALIVGRLSNRFGRRFGLASGFLVGGLGAIGVIFAAIINNVILLFIFLFIYGAGTATNLQARYAGTDLATNKQRGTAISIAMVSTTVGAVAGPNLVEVMSGVALKIGIPELSGPFILSAAAYIVAGLILYVFLRPDPLLIAEKLNEVAEEIDQEESPCLSESNQKGVTVGATIMVVSQIVMVAIMTMTPVHMGEYGHGLKAIGFVIGIHVAFMYLPSLFTGILVDKYGRIVMAIGASLTLLLSGILAAFAPGESLLAMIVALSLLGLGWNLGLISGTALVVDCADRKSRAKTQGTTDVFMALGGAGASAMSGMIVAGFSFAALSILGGILSLALVPVVMGLRK